MLDYRIAAVCGAALGAALAADVYKRQKLQRERFREKERLIFPQKISISGMFKYEWFLI